jgi:hypothetical protein
VTGWGMLADDKGIYLDGGFSRSIHPECEFRLDLPLTMETLLDTFNPSLTPTQVAKLYLAGQTFDHPLTRHEQVSFQSRAASNA